MVEGRTFSQEGGKGADERPDEKDATQGVVPEGGGGAVSDIPASTLEEAEGIDAVGVGHILQTASEKPAERCEGAGFRGLSSLGQQVGQKAQPVS